ncbi:MAG: SDR family oxidoreductase [Bacteroidia bacterium]|nr:SDR family oxidoreductase [Bacteroidia bacterium]
MNGFSGLAGKTIFISGAGSATGMAISLLLLEQRARLVLTDCTEERLDEIKQHPKLASQDTMLVDYTKPELLEESLKAKLPNYAPIFGFVFCGGKGGVRPISLSNPTFTTSMLEVNTVAFIELVRLITRKSIFASGGSIVAISSVSSTRGLKSKTAYAASKAALDASVRCMAKELGERKIRVNSIQKGWVSSDMNAEFIQNNMALSGDNDLANQFLGVIEPEDLAQSVGFLLSDASRFITGVQLVVDGGYNL